MPFLLDPREIQTFEKAIAFLAEFNQVFGRELKPEIIAELYAARELNLQLVDGANHPGYDAVDAQGQRYQIKNRVAQNVDINNFDFDF